MIDMNGRRRGRTRCNRPAGVGARRLWLDIVGDRNGRAASARQWWRNFAHHVASQIFRHCRPKPEWSQTNVQRPFHRALFLALRPARSRTSIASRAVARTAPTGSQVTIAIAIVVKGLAQALQFQNQRTALRSICIPARIGAEARFHTRRPYASSLTHGYALSTAAAARRAGLAPGKAAAGCGGGATLGAFPAATRAKTSWQVPNAIDLPS